MAFAILPTELLQVITRYISDEGDFSAMTRTCRRFFYTFIAELYQRNHIGGKQAALTWATDYGVMVTIQRALGVGIDLVKLHHITLAAQRGYHDIFKALWASKLKYGGFKTLDRDELGGEPFLAAVSSGNRELVEMMLEGGTSDAKNQTSQLRMPLYIACYNGSHEIVKLLLDRGASAMTRFQSQIVPLLVAVSSENDKMGLLKDNRWWGRTSYKLEKNPKGIAETVRILLDCGALMEYTVGYGGHTALHLAAIAGYCDVVEMLYFKGANINTRDGKGNTPLHSSVRYLGELQMTRMLVDFGADIHAVNTKGETPLVMTGETRDPAGVAGFLLPRGSKLIVDAEDNTLLHREPLWHTDLAEVALKHGAKINGMNKRKQTPLHCAADAGAEDRMRILVDRGAALDAKDISGITPLGSAASRCGPSMIRLLIEKGSDSNAKTKEGLPLLHHAVRYNDNGLIQLLIQLGSDVAAPNVYGQGALHYASLVGKINMMEVFLDQGVSVDGHDANGHTPLMCCIEGITYPAFNFLLRRGASVHETDNTRQTALHKASQHTKTIVAKALLEHGADINAKDSKKQTPLHVASRFRRPMMVKMLLEHGADCTISDSKGDTPLMVAKNCGHEEIVELLIQLPVNKDDATANNHESRPRSSWDSASFGGWW